MSLKPKRKDKVIVLFTLAVILAIAFFVHLAGIQQDLPYFAHEDETLFVSLAVNMASQSALNPGWFGHPGSTLIYPLFLIFRFWRSITPETQILFAGAQFSQDLADVWAGYYLVGRLLTVFYAVLSLPFIYLLGKRAFGSRVGVLAALLFVFYPLAVIHAVLVRTDSATIFWGVFSLWLCLRLHDHPTTLRQALAGVTIGLAIATKYSMVALVPVLITVDIIVLKSQWPSGVKRNQVAGPMLGLLAIPIAFIVSTPYFFLDFATAYTNLLNEMRSTHPGMVSFSPVGNLSWYLTWTIPTSMTWLQISLVIVGLIFALSRQKIKQLLLLEFVCIFLVGISISGLHWRRWILPILPILALFVAYGLDEIVKFPTKKLRLGQMSRYGSLIIVALLLSLPHISTLISINQQQLQPDTRVLAGIWLKRNLPSESKIVQEEYTAPLGDHEFMVQKFWSLGDAGYTLADADRYGFQYAVVSSSIYERYFQQPDRYPNQIEFYQTLFDKAVLLKEFKPDTEQRGPTIRIYKLGEDL